MPVQAVISGGKLMSRVGSSTATFGISTKSLTMSACWVLGSASTAVGVASEPLPAVVGTATKNGISFRTLKVPTKSSGDFLGRATRAPASFAQSMADPPPMATMASQLRERKNAAALLTHSTSGLDMTSSNIAVVMPRDSSSFKNCPSVPRFMNPSVVTIIAQEMPWSLSTSHTS